MQIDRIPWETYTLIPTPRSRNAGRNRFTSIYLVLAIIAIVTGGLIAWSKLS